MGAIIGTIRAESLMEIYISKNGVQAGPFPLDEVQKMIAAGQYSSENLGWYSGLTGWIPLGELVLRQTGTESALPPPPDLQEMPPLAPSGPALTPKENIALTVPTEVKRAWNWLKGLLLRSITILFCAVAFIIISFAWKYFTSQSPIEVSFRQSALDSSGLVLQVRNNSDKHLACVMTAQNKLVNQVAKYNFDLGPNETKEIGILESGWSFKSGESVWIETEGYATKEFEVP